MSPPIGCTVPATMVRCALLFFYLSLALLYYHFLTWDGSILLVFMVIFLCVPESHLKGISLHLLSYTLIHVWMFPFFLFVSSSGVSLIFLLSLLISCFKTWSLAPRDQPGALHFDICIMLLIHLLVIQY